MSRFRPDGWGELFSRTFDMADFQSGVYVETIAPDLRPAALLIAVALAVLYWAARRGPGAAEATRTQPENDRVLVSSLLGWLVAWGAWLAISGNGRYALTLLVLVGPLLGATLWRLPIRNDWRWLLLCVVIGAQGMLLNSASSANVWSKLKHRWTTPNPLASREQLLAPLNPDLVIITQSQTMSALLVNTPVVQRARLLSLDFSDSLGAQSVEAKAAERAIAQAQRPVLLDAYIIDFVDPQDIPKFRWRQRSQDMLGRYGLVVDANSCRKEISPLNVLQVACGLQRGSVVVQQSPVANPLATSRMEQLIEACQTSLSPQGARYVLPDGGLVQAFRESKYIIRVDIQGVVYVKRRTELNFARRVDPSEDIRLESENICTNILR